MQHQRFVAKSGLGVELVEVVVYSSIPWFDPLQFLPRNTLGLFLSQTQLLSKFWRSHFAQKLTNFIQADLRDLTKKKRKISIFIKTCHEVSWRTFRGPNDTANMFLL